MIRRNYLSFWRLQWSGLFKVRFIAVMLRLKSIMWSVMMWSVMMGSKVRMWFLVIIFGVRVVMVVIIVG